MESCVMNRNALLDILHTNRTKHLDEFNMLMPAWREKAVAEMQALISEISAGSSTRIAISLYAPVSHIADYDEAIALVTHDTRQTLELSLVDVRRFVMDNWVWKVDHLNSMMTYGKNPALKI